MSGKKLLARTNRSLESPPPHTATSSLFLGRESCFPQRQRVAGEILCQQFSRREEISPATRHCFGSSISPPEKARIFSYNMCSNISLLSTSTWVAWAGNRHKTPRDSSSTAKRHLYVSVQLSVLKNQFAGRFCAIVI